MQRRPRKPLLDPELGRDSAQRERKAKEGERRLDQSMIELLSTGFIVGFTIICGIVALGAVEAVTSGDSHGLIKLADALASGIGPVFLIVGRAELFSENFFDPVASAVQRRKPRMIGSLLRLWGVTFVLNLVGGGLFAWILSVESAIEDGFDADLTETEQARKLNFP